MKLNKILILGVCMLIPSLSYADHDEVTVDAAIGGGIGGAAGGAIGAEIGGRKGAIVGSAAGAAIGAAIATDGPDQAHPKHHYARHGYYPKGGHPHYRHCPPGQAKKGRC
jgi:hypothetical protein